MTDITTLHPTFPHGIDLDVSGSALQTCTLALTVYLLVEHLWQ